MPTRILFVCLGNICRSPAAEAVTNHLIAAEGLQGTVCCDSAGILDVHRGEPADRRMIAQARRRGLRITHASRPVRPEDFERFDLLVGMDQDNVRDLRALAPTPAAVSRIRLMMDYAPECGVREVPDPYYGGPEGFETVLDLLERACAGLLDSLRT